MSFDSKNFVWPEKWRPSTVSAVVGDFREKIQNYLKDPKEMPNFLFHSASPGCGKTTLCKAIINDLGCDSLIINSSDDRTIDVVRERIKVFAMTKSSKPGIRRIVMLDEVDGANKFFQEALRNIMETYSSNVIFLLTANAIGKVIDPIQSRCVLIPFAYPNKEEIFSYLKMICESEQLKHDDDGIHAVIEVNYPSIRNMVLSLQDLKYSDKEVIRANVRAVNALYSEMWDKIKAKDWKFVREAIMANNIDVRELNSYFWEQSLKEENLKVLQLCCRNERDISFGSDAKIILITSLLEMIK